MAKKVIVITGVTKGIGYALSEWFAKAGHLVFGCGRNENNIKNMNESLWAKDCDFQCVDVTSADEVKQWLERVIKIKGAPDLVINNAGIANKPNPLWQVPLEEFNQLIDINLKGVNNVIHFVVPEMLKAGKGVIINMSSGWGRSTAPETAPYCCSKWGIEGLSQALAQELPSPLACAALNPGIINTLMLENFFGESAKSSLSPSEWVKTAGPFLLSIDRKYNGQQLTVPT